MLVNLLVLMELIESAKLQKAELKLERLPKELTNKQKEEEIATTERNIESLRLQKKQKELDSAKLDNDLQRQRIESFRIEQEETSQKLTTDNQSKEPSENTDSHQ